MVLLLTAAIDHHARAVTIGAVPAPSRMLLPSHRLRNRSYYWCILFRSLSHYLSYIVLD